MADSSKSGLICCADLHSWLFNLSFGGYVLYKSWVFSAGSTHWFLDAYFADLLAMPVVLGLLSSGLSLWFRKEIRLSLIQVLGAFLYMSILMEWVAPGRLIYAVADPFDVLCYAIGTAAYLLTR